MKQKINEENTNILCFVSILEKHLQSNQYQDLFLEIRYIRTKYVYLVFCIDRRKAFAIKSIPRSVSRNPLHQNKICLFSISVKFLFRFLYKTMTKQTVYLNNIARKSGCRMHYLRQSVF